MRICPKSANPQNLIPAKLYPLNVTWLTYNITVAMLINFRPHTEAFVSLVALMLDTGLPCFRGETLKRLRQRFAPSLTERQASEYMIQIIKDSYLNKR